MTNKQNTLDTVELVLVGLNWQDKAVAIEEKEGTTAFLHTTCYEFARANEEVYTVKVYVRSGEDDIVYNSTWNVNHNYGGSIKLEDVKRVK